MVARVQLDASHVSKSVTARREKVTRYIRVLNELSRYARSDYTLYACEFLEHTVRETLHDSLRFLLALSIWWFGH